MVGYMDVETNTCVFGCGGIAVVAELYMIVFREIKPPMEVGYTLSRNGEKIGDWEFTGNSLYVELHTLDEVQILHDLLRNVEDNHGDLFEFKNVIFDFTTYNQKSVDVVKGAANRVMTEMLRCMAC